MKAFKRKARSLGVLYIEDEIVELRHAASAVTGTFVIAHKRHSILFIVNLVACIHCLYCTLLSLFPAFLRVVFAIAFPVCTYWLFISRMFSFLNPFYFRIVAQALSCIKAD